MRMSRWLVALSVLVLPGTVFAAEPGNSYLAGSLGISMEVPVSADVQGENDQVAFFFLPPADGFSANVNIQRQRFGDTIEAYDKLSTAQSAQLNFKVLRSARKGSQVLWEHTGDMQGRAAHWYARAVKSGEYVYLVTATALETRWNREKAVLTRSVEGFTVKWPPR